VSAVILEFYLRKMVFGGNSGKAEQKIGNFRTSFQMPENPQKMHDGPLPDRSELMLLPGLSLFARGG
jgi:hypothetical protein